jgi:hypothetical protein
MKGCLSLSDMIHEVCQPQIDEMQRIGNLYPDAQVPDACTAFTRQVRLVEGVVIQTYGVAATLAKKAENPDEVSDVWYKLSRFCQTALQILADLKHKYPYCGTPQLYDLILDYKLAADKRYKGAMEEATCQKMEFPAKLFPKLN